MDGGILSGCCEKTVKRVRLTGRLVVFPARMCNNRSYITATTCGWFGCMGIDHEILVTTAMTPLFGGASVLVYNLNHRHVRVDSYRTLFFLQEEENQ